MQQTHPGARWRMRGNAVRKGGRQRPALRMPGTTGLAWLGADHLRTAGEVTHKTHRLGPVVRSGSGSGSRSCHQPTGIPEFLRPPGPILASLIMRPPVQRRRPRHGRRGSTRFPPPDPSSCQHELTTTINNQFGYFVKLHLRKWFNANTARRLRRGEMTRSFLFPVS